MNPEEALAWIWNYVFHFDSDQWMPWIRTSALQAALADEWPLRCEMKPKPSTRLADDLPE